MVATGMIISAEATRSDGSRTPAHKQQFLFAVGR
jgi:hypothetical protein